MLRDLRIGEFLDRLAAKTPTPGGGSAGALAGAVGSALGVMATRFSGAGPEADLEALRREFAELIDRDSEAYSRFDAALKLPKGSDAEKKARSAAMQEAAVGAARVPLEGIGRCGRALDLLAAFAPQCTKHLASDLASGAILLQAAARVMVQNVVINLGSIRDPKTADSLRSHMNAAMRAVDAGYAGVMAHVDKLGG